MRTVRAVNALGLLAVIVACGGLAFDDGSDVTTVAESRTASGSANAGGPNPARGDETGSSGQNGGRGPARNASRDADEAGGDGNQAGSMAVPCAAGDISCAGRVLHACNGDGRGWVQLDVCESAGACNANAGACDGVASDPDAASPACEPGALRCNGASLQVCLESPPGWLTLQVCASSALCVAGDGRAAGCIEPTCAADDSRCEGASLQRCADDLTAFATVGVCISPEICEISRASGAFRCVPPGSCMP